LRFPYPTSSLFRTILYQENNFGKDKVLALEKFIIDRNKKGDFLSPEKFYRLVLFT